jgi:hypothetical protein
MLLSLMLMVLLLLMFIVAVLPSWS